MVGLTLSNCFEMSLLWDNINHPVNVPHVYLYLSQLIAWYVAFFILSSDHRLRDVLVGVKDIPPDLTSNPNPTVSDFKECGRIVGIVGSAETVVVMCPPGGVLGRYLVVMIDSSSADNRLAVCEITATGSK